MTKSEIIASFTPAQRKEFDQDIEHLVLRAATDYDFDSSKVAEINTNMRLQDEFFLNVSLRFHMDDIGNVSGEITDLIKFPTIDEYLDAINQAKNPPFGFRNIKP